jgi:hypothetical protein
MIKKSSMRFSDSDDLFDDSDKSSKTPEINK